jgi:hypothetical protein
MTFPVIPHNRLVDWSERLNAYLLSARRRPHVYGDHDCLLHPAAAVEAVTGDDLGEQHRGRYRSQASAVRHLKALGFASPKDLLSALFEEVPVGFAQRGDLVLTPANEEGEWELPGVCIGAVALCVSAAGLVREPRERWLKAWKVGR